MADSAGIDQIAAEVGAMVAAGYGDGAFEIVRQELVGPKIGAELQQKAALAVLFSLALTLIYIAIRFEFRFGVASVIATAHDVLVTLGFLALFRVEISLPTVAAILTILGYSLNDTIVVFDRIRENLNARGGRRENPYKMVNRSINETLPRTVLTSGTTLAVLLSLLILGGAVIRDFTMVLILGVLIGTYSSIFIASPALLEIQKRYGTGDAKEKQKKQRARAAAAVCEADGLALPPYRRRVRRRSASRNRPRPRRRRRPNRLGRVGPGRRRCRAEAGADLRRRLVHGWGAPPTRCPPMAPAPSSPPMRCGKRAPTPRCIAIGETGLDYYYDNAPRGRASAAASSATPKLRRRRAFPWSCTPAMRPRTRPPRSGSATARRPACSTASRARPPSWKRPWRWAGWCRSPEPSPSDGSKPTWFGPFRRAAT